MERLTVESPGAAVDWLMTRTLLAYRRKHASGIPVIDLFATHVRQVENELEYYPYGVLHVTCTVHSKTWTPSFHEFARFERSNEVEYLYTGGTLDL